MLNEEHIDELIARHLANECSAVETARLEAWRNNSPANEQYYQQSLKLFRILDTAKNNLEVDADSAWNKITDRIDNSQAKVIPLFRIGKIARIAASVLMVLALVYLLYQKHERSSPELQLSTVSEPRESTLPDGSQVQMKANTELSYLTSKGKRTVKLKGEAYFNVKHDEAVAFEIDLDGVFVQDIGTAFNVVAVPGSDLVVVNVDEGEVRFYDKLGNSMNLVQDESAVYERSSGKFTKTSTAVQAEIKRSFIFEEKALNEIIAEISKAYGTSILLENQELGKCKVSVEFNNEDPDMIVEVLAQTLDLTVTRQAGSYTLSGQPCHD